MAEAEVVPPSQNGGSGVDLVSEKPVHTLALLHDTEVVRKEASAIINESDDKLDEFSRLELEMAEMDKTDDGGDNINLISCVNDALDELKDKSDDIANKDVGTQNELKHKNQPGHDDNSIAQQNGQNTTNKIDTAMSAIAEDKNLLDHEDLIAVLKGDSNENPSSSSFGKEQQSKLSSTKVSETDSPPVATVPETESDILIEGVTIEGEGEYQIMEVVDDFEDDTVDMMPSTSKASITSSAQGSKVSTTSAKLTPEEVRAMAMEQIAGLNARLPRRRKQDIKPLQIETSELVSTLGADWTDDDDMAVDGERPTSSKNATANKQTKILKKELPSKTQASGQDNAVSTATGAAKKRRNSNSVKVTSVVVVKSAADDLTNQTPSSAANSVVAQATHESTGFKRTRTIKRRIIWDPDAPETTFSYAKLVRNNAKERQEASSPSAVGTKPRSVTPKEIIPGEKRGTKRALTPSQSNASKMATNESNHKGENLETPSTSKLSRRSNTLSPAEVGGGSVNIVAGGKKKKISEIDRLMGDEGAANMLNSLESERNKPGDESDSKPHKPLMRNRGGATEKVTKKDAAATMQIASTAATKAKRVNKPKLSTTWDYVYQKKQQLSEDSMIIRRRSNSSYSSNASQHRLSLDGPSGPSLKGNAKGSEVSSDEATDNGTSTASTESSTPRKASGTKAASKSPANNSIVDEESLSPIFKAAMATMEAATGNKNFEFAKPKDAKSAQKPTNRRSKGGNANSSANTLASDIKKAMPKRGGGRISATERLAANQADQSNAQSPTSNNYSINATSSTEDVIVRKIGKTAHILFNMNSAQISCTFTPQLMNKIVSTLNNLAEDVNCHVVVVTTNSPHFCQGVDIANLASGSADQRKSAAIVLATATKNFLRTLATFPKPLVAGIHGTIIGLGVIQLPLYDVVIASDKTSFETPYTKIGQTPEGYCIWQSLPNIRETAKTKLLWMAEKMYSTEASTTGLIDKLTTAERVNDDAMNIAKKLATMSTETYRYMKNFIVQKRSEAINLSLDNEFDEITTQWTSLECFNKFKKSLDVGHF